MAKSKKSKTTKRNTLPAFRKVRNEDGYYTYSTTDGKWSCTQVEEMEDS